MKQRIADVADLEAQEIKKYRWQNFNEDELKDLALSSSSLKDFTKKLGYTAYSTKIKNQILLQYPNLKEVFNFLPHGGKDLTSLEFGLLKVLSFNLEESILQKHRCWNCLCKCGRQTVVRTNRLINGEIKSCLNCSKRENLTNQRFGRLVCLEIDEQKSKENSEKRIVWKCQCDCGNISFITAHSLKQNNTLSCGCLNISKGEYLLEKLLKENNINYQKQYSFKDLKEKRVLRFDFAIFNNDNKLKCLIEYQGEQHFKIVEYFGGEENFIKQQKYDEEKRKYCERNNIKLIEIPYYDFAKINLDYLKNRMGGL